MNGLWRKDLPWWLGGIVAGVVGCAIAICERGWMWTFVLEPSRPEALFHVAWTLGLALGFVAGSFDALLGTEDLLRTRPVSPQRVLRARLVGVAVVLLSWWVLAPLAAAFVLRFGEHEPLPASWDAIGALLATMVPAASAAAIGLVAIRLPVAIGWRVVAAGAVLVPSYAAIEGLATSGASLTAMAPFALGHLTLAAVVGVVGWTLAGLRHDADRPLPAAARSFAVAPAVVAAVLLVAGVLGQLARNHARLLQQAYPRVVVADGQLRLAAAQRWPDRGYRLCDAEHVATGPVRTTGIEERSLFRVRASFHEPGFSGPRWSGAPQLEWRQTLQVLLARDGRVFVQRVGSPPRPEWVPSGKGAELVPFAAGSSTGTLDDGDDHVAVVAERATGTVWRLDAERGHFVAVPLPDGDRWTGFRHVRAADFEDRSVAARLAFPPDDQTRALVEGERGLYALQGGAWVAVPKQSRREERREPLAATGMDPLEFTVDVPAAGDRAAFRHEFEPRTAFERWVAVLALAPSVLRPPPLQVASHLLRDDDAPAWSTLDPLVAGGRRPWLVLAGLLATALAALLADRRLCRLGAGPSVRRPWFALALLAGPFAAVAGVLLERPRAFAAGPAPAPETPPRLFSPRPEVPA